MTPSVGWLFLVLSAVGWGLAFLYGWAYYQTRASLEAVANAARAALEAQRGMRGTAQEQIDYVLKGIADEAKNDEDYQAFLDYLDKEKRQEPF